MHWPPRQNGAKAAAEFCIYAERQTNGKRQRLKNMRGNWTASNYDFNRINRLINLLCGYASIERNGTDFTTFEEDDRISRVAKGITKYCLDRANYQRNKGKCFRDKLFRGLANYWVSYEFDYTKLDGTIQN